MAHIENKYYLQVPANDVESEPTNGNRLKSGIALMGVSCLALLCVVIASTSSPAQTTTEQSSNLIALPASASLRAVKPGALMLPGSGPFKNLALSKLAAINHQHSRNFKVRADTGGATATAEEKEIEEAAEKEVKIKASEMAGNTGPLGFFDPAGFSTDASAGKLLFYREVEIKHGRVGMLASLGFLVGEQFHPLFGGKIDVPSYISFQETPLQSFWPAVVIALAIPEVNSVFTFQDPDQTMDQFWTMKTDANRVPGDFGFDPLGLRPRDPAQLRELQNKELNNGRLAMIAAAGMIAQELATGKKLF